MLERDKAIIWEAAKRAHEVNAAYCEATGDDSQLPWDAAPKWQRDSAYEGALGIFEGRIKSPGDSHQSWYAHKVKEGWIYGSVKDAEKKTHPCMVPFKYLPANQQAKDHIFLAVVKATFLQHAENLETLAVQVEG